MNIKNTALDLCTTKRKCLFLPFFQFLGPFFRGWQTKVSQRGGRWHSKEDRLQKVQPQKKEKVIFVSCDIENEQRGSRSEAD